MSKETSVNTQIIDDAVAGARMRGNGHFVLSDVLALLPSDNKSTAERVRRVLESDESLFCGNDEYTGRGEFFSGREFVLTPSSYEIESGILFPGHRFTAFMSPEIFPAEIELTCKDGIAPALREITGELVQFFPYHMLMGSEQVFDFFIAENHSNAKLAHGAGAVEKITLNVFDMADFYRRHNFTEGDALLCRVSDWSKGRFVCSYLSGEERSTGNIRQWVSLFDDAAGAVIDRFDNFPDIPEQLSWAFFIGGQALMDGRKAASLDEYIKMTGKLDISLEAGHSVLVRRSSSGDDYDFDAGVPEGVGISKGETDSLSGMLGDVGLAVTPVEIDSYILDACYFRELDYESFFARCFGREPIAFADDAQEAVFLNYVEDRWEELTGNYNRTEDEPKAEIRSQILEIIDEKSAFLREFKERGEAQACLPEEEMRRLAELSLYLDEILRLLNSPSHTLAEGEAAELAETVAGVGDTQDMIIQKIENHGADNE